MWGVTGVVGSQPGTGRSWLRPRLCAQWGTNMDSGSKGIASERATALVVYQLADSLVQFRYYIELNYLGADEPYAFGGEHPPPPPIIQECVGQVLAAATRLAHTLSVPEAKALISATRSILQQFRETWLDEMHRKLIAEWRDVSETTEFGNTRERKWSIVMNSPFAPPVWGELQAIADRLAQELPNSYCLVFNLSRLLAEICFPCPSSYSTAMEDIPVFDDDHLITDIGPKIADLVHEIRTRFHLLQTVEEWLDGENPYGAAVRLREDVLSDLATASRLGTAANASALPESPPPDGAAPCVTSTTPSAHVPSLGSSQHQLQNDGVCSATGISTQNSGHTEIEMSLTSSIEAPSVPAMPRVDATLFVAPLGPDEDVRTLSAMKKEMDPDDAYIGQSLPVLRLFHQIAALNRLPDDPIVILVLQDIVDFWATEYALTPDSLAPPPKAAKIRAKSSPPKEIGTRAKKRTTKATFTPRQGQFLAFIHLYRKLHRRGPAESDLRVFFGVTAPAVHGMVVKLEELGLITREPGVARSMRVAIPAERLPELETTDGPPW